MDCPQELIRSAIVLIYAPRLDRGKPLGPFRGSSGKPRDKCRVLRGGQPLLQGDHERLVVPGQKGFAVNPKTWERTNSIHIIRVGLQFSIGPQIEPANLVFAQAQDKVFENAVARVVVADNARDGAAEALERWVLGAAPRAGVFLS